MTLPPTIHGEISVFGDTTETSVYTAECTVGWDAAATTALVAGHDILLPVPAETGPGSLDGGGNGKVSKTAAITLKGEVFPTSVSTTTPSEIPVTGNYLVGSPRIEPYKARWFQCHVQVVNASVFAV